MCSRYISPRTAASDGLSSNGYVNFDVVMKYGIEIYIFSFYKHYLDMHMVDPFYVKTPITSVLYSHEKKIVVVCCFKNQSRKVLQSVHKMDDVTVGTD